MQKLAFRRTIVTIASFSILAIYALSISMIALPYQVYLDKRSDYRAVADQASWALLQMDAEEYEKLKDRRASVQRSMSSYENRVLNAMYFSAFTMASATAPYICIWVWYVRGTRKREFRRPEDYPFGHTGRYYEDDRPGVQ